MNTFLDFLSDNTFFAIFSGVIIVLVLAFIVTLIKGKKEDKKPIEDVPEESYFNNQQEVLTNEPITASIDSNYNYETSIETQIMGNSSESTEYQTAFTNYVPDLNEEPVSEQIDTNIPNINYENVAVNEPIMPEAQEIDIPLPTEVKEEIAVPFIEPTITKTPDVFDSIIPDFQEKEEVQFEPIVEASEPDEIEMPIPITETPELAFASLPTDDNTIN
ncbi:MAG: hypothetical protein K2G03_01415, partial [Bacilli bacterium]|nr:hypothetical protein [Bacilli bacterium]